MHGEPQQPREELLPIHAEVDRPAETPSLCRGELLVHTLAEIGMLTR